MALYQGFNTIPDDWRIVKIRDLFNLYKGTTPSTKVPDYWNGDIPFVTPTDITTLSRSDQVFLERTSKYLTEKGMESKRLKLVPKNSLLVTTRATIGECAINKIEVTINQGIVALIPKEPNKVDVLFYYYLIQIMKPYLKSLAGGSTYKEISLKRLGEVSIPLPPLDEQRKIARILYTVDEAIAKTETIISRVEELRRALLDYLMTHGIGHREYKETEIGKIPKEWKVVKLHEVATIKHGKRPHIILERGGFPIFGAGGLAGYTDSYLVDDEFIIVVARVGAGSVGKVYLAKGKVWISDNALYIQCRKDLIYPPYLYYSLIKINLRKMAYRAAGGHAVITRNLLESLKIPLPSLDEQIKIAEILEMIDKLLKAETIHKEILIKLKNSLMNLLLVGKVRVKDSPID